MLGSIEIPPKKPKLSDNARAAWLMVLLVVIIIFAMYCMTTYGNVAVAG